MRWMVRIAILVVIAGGAFVFRDRLSSNAGELQVGDCFDDPAGATEIHDVQHHPCTEAHTAEVVYLGKLAGDKSSYPTDTVVEAWVRTNCLPAWESYTGKSFEAEPVLSIGYYQPTPKGWSGGDRDVICYAAREDNGMLTTSVRKGS